jgi:hypothetical protein
MAEELPESKEQKPVEAEEEVDASLEQKLAFPTAAVVREMKKYIAKDKMIRKEVKIAMNKFLADIVKDISQSMDKFPYSVVDYRMFEDAIKPYKRVKDLQGEKRRLVAHLDSIIEDCASVKRDLDIKFGNEGE